jgi:1-acyl-sn-glycerol-3-phosphate acyltransferase
MTSWSYAFSKFICWLTFRIRFDLRVSGRQHVPRTGAFILAANHVSFLDPPVVGSACPRRLRFLARADLFRHARLGGWMRSVGVIPVKRGEADLPAVRAALRVLRRGEPVAIFPEGGRQISGALGRAKRGVGLLAEAAGVPIIPAFVQGTFEALPPDAKRFGSAKIRVAFGPPISYTTGSSATSWRDQGPAASLAGARDAVPSGAKGAAQAGQPARVRHQAVADEVTRAWQRLKGQLGAAAGRQELPSPGRDRSPSCHDHH